MAEINPYRPPEHDHDEPPPLRPPLKPLLDPGDFPRAWRIAGACLIVNALLVFAEKLTMQTSGGPSVGLAPIIDLLIGGALSAGQGKYRVWAIVRCGLGAVVFSVIAAGQGDYISLAMQLCVSGSLLALLVGRPGLARTIVAGVVFGLYVVVCVIGLVALGAHGG